MNDPDGVDADSMLCVCAKRQWTLALCQFHFMSLSEAVETAGAESNALHFTCECIHPLFMNCMDCDRKWPSETDIFVDAHTILEMTFNALAWVVRRRCWIKTIKCTHIHTGTHRCFWCSKMCKLIYIRVQRAFERPHDAAGCGVASKKYYYPNDGTSVLYGIFVQCYHLDPCHFIENIGFQIMSLMYEWRQPFGGAAACCVRVWCDLWWLKRAHRRNINADNMSFTHTGDLTAVNLNIAPSDVVESLSTDGIRFINPSINEIWPAWPTPSDPYIHTVLHRRSGREREKSSVPDTHTHTHRHTAHVMQDHNSNGWHETAAEEIGEHIKWPNKSNNKFMNGITASTIRHTHTHTYTYDLHTFELKLCVERCRKNAITLSHCMPSFATTRPNTNFAPEKFE